MNKWYQTIIVNHKEEEGKTTHWLDDENYKTLCKERAEQLKEIERLKSIIKEVREYIENGNYRFREGTDICLYQEGNEVFYMENDELMARKILSILDKENK